MTNIEQFILSRMTPVEQDRLLRVLAAGPYREGAIIDLICERLRDMANIGLMDILYPELPKEGN